MQQVMSRLRQSASVKILTIGFLILVLLIPLGMVRDTINDRSNVHLTAKMDIQRTWGQSQLIAGPALILPYDLVRINERGERRVDRRELYILPKTLDIDAAAESEIRYRGIHKVPVYSARVALKARFDGVDPEKLGIGGYNIHWSEAAIALGISDGRAITVTPTANVNGQSTSFVPGGQRIDALPPQIEAPLRGVVDLARADELSFDTVLEIKGSESLYFLPLGDSTRASLTSGWPTPSFAGSYLPETREVSEAGFTADWKVSSIGRSLPSHWTEGSRAADSARSDAFGVELYMPISVYRLTLRSVKYGILFIVLTFVSYFIFEVIAGLRLHPLQYLMVGMANVIFFLLLIALAEHTGFGWSYLLSALAASGLIVGYSRAVLGTRRRTLIIGSVAFALYAFLYMTLKAETYALLAGSVGLWVVLAAIMYLTRRIDWYERSARPEKDRPDAPIEDAAAQTPSSN